MYGLAIIVIMSLSGHLSNIMRSVQKLLSSWHKDFLAYSNFTSLNNAS